MPVPKLKRRQKLEKWSKADDFLEYKPGFGNIIFKNWSEEVGKEVDKQQLTFAVFTFNDIAIATGLSPVDIEKMYQAKVIPPFKSYRNGQLGYDDNTFNLVVDAITDSAEEADLLDFSKQEFRGKIKELIEQNHDLYMNHNFRE